MKTNILFLILAVGLIAVSVGLSNSQQVNDESHIEVINNSDFDLLIFKGEIIKDSFIGELRAKTSTPVKLPGKEILRE